MKLHIEIPDADAALIEELLAAQEGEFTSHDRLDLKSLAEMLLEDVALAVRRPGSWEGANMRTVLTCHGYRV